MCFSFDSYYFDLCISLPDPVTGPATDQLQWDMQSRCEPGHPARVQGGVAEHKVEVLGFVHQQEHAGAQICERVQPAHPDHPGAEQGLDVEGLWLFVPFF